MSDTVGKIESLCSMNLGTFVHEDKHKELEEQLETALKHIDVLLKHHNTPMPSEFNRPVQYKEWQKENMKELGEKCSARIFYNERKGIDFDE